MIDFHTHILPGIDDGSRSVEMTMQMLNAETEQGVTGIVATPHFYAHKSNIEDFLAVREESFVSVQREIAGSDEDLIYPPFPARREKGRYAGFPRGGDARGERKARYPDRKRQNSSFHLLLFLFQRCR